MLWLLNQIMEKYSRITIDKKQKEEFGQIVNGFHQYENPDIEMTGEVRLAMELLRKFNEDRLLAYLASLEEEQNNDDKFENNKLSNQDVQPDE